MKLTEKYNITIKQLYKEFKEIRESDRIWIDSELAYHLTDLSLELGLRNDPDITEEDIYGNY